MLPGSGAAQNAQLGTSKPACQACSIVLRRTATLGSAEDSIGFAVDASLAVNGRQQFFVASESIRGRVAVFDRGGRLVRTIGRVGQGPGEFNGPLAMTVGPGDSLLIVEQQTGRFAVYDQALALRRSGGFRTASGYELLWLSGSAVVLSTWQPHGDTLATMLLTDAQGSSVRRLALATPPARTGEALLRVFGRAGPERFVSAEMGKYRIELWNTTGALIRSWERSPDWFLDSVPRKPGPPGMSPFPSRITGVRVDDAGLVWVLATVMDSRWTPDTARGPSAPADLFDTMIEVIDPRTNIVVATARSDLVLRFTQNGEALAYGLEEVPGGDLRLAVFTPVLIGYEGSGRQKWRASTF
jgi:hypothetical protein